MEVKTKRRLSYVTLAVYYIVGGVEYAVIFPTIWMFLQSLGATSEQFMGFAVSAYSLAGVFSEPAVGRWFDKTKNTKLIVLIMNIFEIAGSLLYFIGISPPAVVLSRLVCGIGGGAGTAAIADISLSTIPEKRTRIVSNLNACRQVGLLFGPALNLLLKEMNFYIGPFIVNELTAPGLFMALIWSVTEILFLTMYFNLRALNDREKLQESLLYSGSGEYNHEEETGNCSYGSINTSDSMNSFSHDLREPQIDGTNNHNYQHQHEKPQAPILPSKVIDHQNVSLSEEFNSAGASLVREQPHPVHTQNESFLSSQMIEDAERAIEDYSDLSGSNPCVSRSHDGITALPLQADQAADSPSDIAKNESRPQSYLFQLADEFIRDEIVVLLGLNFMSMFAQSSLETIVTPLSQKFYLYGDMENSLLFLFAGIEILVVVLLLNWLSRRFSDRVLLMIGAFSLNISLAWYLAFVPWFPEADQRTLPYFAVGVVINLFSIPFLVICSVSLFSKVVTPSKQGIGHGLRRSSMSMGLIIGPLWGSSVIHNLVLLFSIPLGVMILVQGMMVLSFHRLQPEMDVCFSNRSFNKSNECCTDESQPLLGSSNT